MKVKISRSTNANSDQLRHITSPSQQSEFLFFKFFMNTQCPYSLFHYAFIKWSRVNVTWFVIHYAAAARMSAVMNYTWENAWSSWNDVSQRTNGRKLNTKPDYYLFLPRCM